MASTAKVKVPDMKCVVTTTDAKLMGDAERERHRHKSQMVARLLPYRNGLLTFLSPIPVFLNLSETAVR